MNRERDHELAKAFGSHFRQLRQRKGFTARGLASSLAIDISTIHRIEKGLGNPTLQSLEQFAGIFNVSLAELVSFSK